MPLSSGSSWPAKAERQLCLTEAVWIPEYLAQNGPRSSELQKNKSYHYVCQASDLPWHQMLKLNPCEMYVHWNFCGKRIYVTRI